ncbi:copper resistance CopC/CopD family protein [Streptomyces sp. NPDC058371]|uniref:copper resistance CopC/CopD family protein n=1 Tax=Streptomyces sp. NPDC058371 TaxID=3346463 RepID=UPI00365B3497
MLLGAVLVLLVLGGAGPASAHAALSGTDPRDGTVLKSAPRHVTLTFTESVGLLDDSFRVLDPENRRVHTGEAGHAGGRSETARVTLPRDLGTGTFTVAWRVVSADSHPVSGAFTFSVGKPSATSVVLPSDASGNTAAGTLYDAARYFAYAAVALLIGAATFAVVTGVAPVRTLLLAGWWTLLLSTVALLLLRGPYEQGSGLSTALDPSALATTLTGRPGVALLARLVLLAAVALLPMRIPARLLEDGDEAVRGGEADADAGAGAGAGAGGDVASGGEPGPVGDDLPQTGTGKADASDPAEDSTPTKDATPAEIFSPPRGVLVAGGVLAVSLTTTWAAAEHASAGIQVPVAMVSAVLHLLSMAVWLGGLAALLTALQRAPESLPATAVARFSRLAFIAVAVLVATGVYQSWRGLGSWDALTSTSYGRILIAKLAAVLLVLAAAAYSRRWTARLLTTARQVTTARLATTADRTIPAPARLPERVGAPAALGDESDDVRADSDDVRADSDDVRADGERRDGERPDGVRPDGVRPDAGAALPEGSPDPGTYRRALRRSVLAEVTIGIVVLVITTVLTGTQPGRAATEAKAASASSASSADQSVGSTTLIPFDVGTPGGHGKVQIDLAPGRVGENTVQAVIIGPDGGIATVPELRLNFTLAKEKIGPLDANVTNRGGYWGADSVNLPLPGTWTMKVTIRTTDIDQVTVSKTVKIR